MSIILPIVFIAIGAVFIYTGILGVRGRTISVLLRDGSLRQVAGTAARFWGAFYLVWGLVFIWLTVKVLCPDPASARAAGRHPGAPGHQHHPLDTQRGPGVDASVFFGALRANSWVV